LTESDQDEEEEDDEEEDEDEDEEDEEHTLENETHVESGQNAKTNIQFFSKALATREKIALKKSFTGHLKEYIMQ
jgi:hypothetical protein